MNALGVCRTDVHVAKRLTLYWCMFVLLLSGLNRISSVIVERVLVDEIRWYKVVVRAIQGESVGVDLSETQLVNKVKSEFRNVRVCRLVPRSKASRAFRLHLFLQNLERDRRVLLKKSVCNLNLTY